MRVIGRRQLASRRRDGQVLPVFMVAIIALLLLNGLVFDTGMLYVARRHAQAAADAAVIGAARELSRGMGTAAVQAAGLEDAKRNGFDDEASHIVVTVSTPPQSGPNLGNSQFAEAVVQVNVRSFFLHLAGHEVNLVGHGRWRA